MGKSNTRLTVYSYPIDTCGFWLRMALFCTKFILSTPRILLRKETQVGSSKLGVPEWKRSYFAIFGINCCGRVSLAKLIRILCWANSPSEWTRSEQQRWGGQGKFARTREHVRAPNRKRMTFIWRHFDLDYYTTTKNIKLAPSGKLRMDIKGLLLLAQWWWQQQGGHFSCRKSISSLAIVDWRN